MDAISFLKTIRQMCRQSCCEDCPWSTPCEKHFLSYKCYTDRDFEEIVKKVENWNGLAGGVGKFLVLRKEIE